jgi:hypothetical protein
VQNPSFRKPVVDNVTKTAPRKFGALTSAPQGTEPMTRDLSPKGLDARKVARNSMIVHKALHDCSKPLSQLGDALMTSSHERLFYRLKLAAKPLRYCLALDNEALPVSGCRTDMSKPKEIKSLGLTLTTLFPVCSSKAPELNQSRLVRVQTEAELAHTLCKLPEKPFRLLPVLKPHDEIIGVSHDNHVTSGTSPAPLLYPKVQHVVQVDVGEQRRKHSTNAKGNFEFMRRLPFRGKRD